MTDKDTSHGTGDVPDPAGGPEEPTAPPSGAGPPDPSAATPSPTDGATTADPDALPSADPVSTGGSAPDEGAIGIPASGATPGLTDTTEAPAGEGREAPSAGATLPETTGDEALAGGSDPDSVDGAAPAGAAGGPLRSERIQLVGESGAALTVGVRTVLGKHIVRQFGEDYNVWDAEQCVVERDADGAWQIVPREGTTNETLLNGEALNEARPLNEGDVIAVGRAAKGIVRLPLTARPA